MKNIQFWTHPINKTTILKAKKRINKKLAMLGPAARKVKTHGFSNYVSPRRTQNLVIFEKKTFWRFLLNFEMSNLKNIQFWKHPIGKNNKIEKNRPWKKLAILGGRCPERWNSRFCFFQCSLARRGPQFSHLWTDHFEQIQIQQITILHNEHFQILHFQNDDFFFKKKCFF